MNMRRLLTRNRFVALGAVAALAMAFTVTRGDVGSDPLDQEAVSPLDVADDDSGAQQYGPDYARRQKALAAVVEPVHRAAASLPNFAGIFIDNPGGTVLVIRGVGDLSDLEVIAAQYSAPPDRMVVARSAEYPQAELEELHARIAADMPRWEDSGVTIVQVGVDPVANRVGIGVLDLTDEGRTVLAAAYGERVVVSASTAYEELRAPRSQPAGS